MKKQLMMGWLAFPILCTLAGCGLLFNNQQPNSENSAQAWPQFHPDLPGITFIEQVTAEQGAIIIPYHKYQLDNGLTVIIHQDHSDPLVHLDVTYHVGSAREEIGKSGFAHFFEHMMFQGSEHVADEQHFQLITEAGGTLNGSTNSDRTNYYQTLPKNHLATALWLEADRMGFLLDAVTQQKFEVQRETVKNERAQRIDNQPYGRLGERINQALYPYGHPYSWPVIGYVEDLNRVNVNDLKQFFLHWYGPNNATLTIGGDVQIQEVLTLVNRYFGTIPRGREVSKPVKELVVLNEDRYISMEDNVHLPLIHLTFPTVYARHPDEAPLDILAEILGGGKTSILYKNLVKNRLAVQAQVSHPCAELGCRFNLLALPQPTSGKTLADLEQVIRQSLLEFEQRGVNDDDLIKVKAAIEASSIFGLQSVAGKVTRLAANQIYTGDPNYIGADIQRYNQVTKADVMRVFQQYIKDHHAVIMSIVPKGAKEMISRQDTFTPKLYKSSQQSTTSVADLQLRRAVDLNSNFDRSTPPAVAAASSVNVPDYWKKSMANGIEVLGTQNNETPTTSILIKVAAGHLYNSTEQAGMASLMARMLKESTIRHTPEQMSQRLEKLGSSIRLQVSDHTLNIQLNTLTKQLIPTLNILHEWLFEPRFAEEDVKRLKQQRLQSIYNSQKKTEYLAALAFKRLMFGDGIAGQARQGNIASLSAMTTADLQNFYQGYFKPSQTQMIIASDLSQQQIWPHLHSFTTWQGDSPELKNEIPQRQSSTLQIYLVDKAQATQASIRIGKRGLPFDIDGEFYRTTLLNFALGGNFNSRLNLNLREEKGYTYGVSSTFWGDPLVGGFMVDTSVRTDVTMLAIREILSEIRTYQQHGLTAQELAFTRNAINQQQALQYETPGAKLGFLAQILEYDLPADFVQIRNDILTDIQLDELNRLAHKHLDVEEMLIVVVGDAQRLKPQLAELGYPIIDYQVE